MQCEKCGSKMEWCELSATWTHTCCEEYGLSSQLGDKVMKVNLSERIRPNCEAAPWVVEEVKQLEAENAQVIKERDYLVEVVSKAAKWPEGCDTYAHAIGHIENVISNLRCDLSVEKAENERLKNSNDATLSGLLLRVRELQAEALKLRETAEAIATDGGYSGASFMCLKALKSAPRTAELAKVLKCVDAVCSNIPYNQTVEGFALVKAYRKYQDVKCHHRFTKPLNDNSVCVLCDIPYRKYQEVK